MKETIIPAGYRITVVSWENDGDSYQSKVVEGLSKGGAEFTIKLCKLHCSKDNRTQKVFGNLYEPDDSELRDHESALQQLIDEHQGELPAYCHNVPLLRDYLVNLGLSGTSEFYTRAFAHAKVEYVQHEIRLQDVTEEFENT